MGTTGIVSVVFIVFASILIGLVMVCWTIVQLLTGGRGHRATRDDESKLMQELYHGLSKMEERVESLETLLLDREKGGGHG